MDTQLVTAIISMGFLAVSFALVLGLAHKKLKVEEDPRIEDLTQVLPGVNCGACGYLSCHDFAEHIAVKGEDPSKCRIMDKEQSEKVHEIMGSDSSAPVFKSLPVVRCSARTENKKKDVGYDGVRTCGAAQQIFGGGISCEFGCMGYGDCARSCPFDALHMEDGLPRLDEEKCTSCGKCAEACPRELIELMPKENKDLFYVACKSTDSALRVREICGVGCIGCGICVKLSGGELFELIGPLAREKKEAQRKKEDTEKIRSKCPTKVIKAL